MKRLLVLALFVVFSWTFVEDYGRPMFDRGERHNSVLYRTWEKDC